MAGGVPRDDRDLAAGDFSPWIEGMHAAIRGERGSDVPCGGCTACCTSSQFVHIGPDETDTLSYIPAELLFPAPRLPAGHVVMGYDERGHCPMLIDNRCSIYEHRPQTCRTYDCRIFPATGTGLDGDDKAAVETYERILKAAPHTVEAATAIQTIHERTGDWPKLVDMPALRRRTAGKTRL